ncbi:MAG: hypothetical protein H0X30_27210 [Anaerolineae bacterium]|nr:hypothetical protein [Anaerolineae bacterium]
MAQETGSSMLGCFPAVLVAVLFGFLTFLGARQSAASMELVAPVEAQAQSAAPVDAVEGKQSLTVIEKVETQISASVPATVTLHVMGYQPDGCTFPVQVQQTRTADQVTIKIFRIVPKDVMCTMELNPYNDTITLDGTFDSGTYSVDVNGTVVVVKV